MKLYHLLLIIIQFKCDDFNEMANMVVNMYSRSDADAQFKKKELDGILSNIRNKETELDFIGKKLKKEKELIEKELELYLNELDKEKIKELIELEKDQSNSNLIKLIYNELKNKNLKLTIKDFNLNYKNQLESILLKLNQVNQKMKKNIELDLNNVGILFDKFLELIDQDEEL